jgi:preprotein translocase subunit SecG
MQTEFGGGIGIKVGAGMDEDATSFSNGNAAGWARNWFIIAVIFILIVTISGRGKR